MPRIIAEIGASHNGKLEIALALVEAAAQSGAGMVKFQIYTPEQMAIPGYKIKDGPWKGRDLIDLYREAQTPREWASILFERARELNLVPFASPFHQNDVEFLETLDCSFYKIASFEIVDLELISLVSNTGKPVFISTGSADPIDIERALEAAKACKDITLLHCVSQYPTKLDQCNLLTMVSLSNYGSSVGVVLV